MAPAEKRAAYARDVTYATAKEAGFDFLRDRLAYETGRARPPAVPFRPRRRGRLHPDRRGPHPARHLGRRGPRGSTRAAAWLRRRPRLVPGATTRPTTSSRNVFLTEAGIAGDRVAARLRATSTRPRTSRSSRPLYCALHAERLLARDVDYIVRDGRIEIVDEFTGRVVDKRHWPDGLQAAVEAKEGAGPQVRGPHPRLDHPAALLPALPAALRDDGHGPVRGRGAQGILRAERRRRPAAQPQRRGATLPDAVFTHQRGQARGARRGDRRTSTPPAGRSWSGTASVKESEELAADLGAAGRRLRRPQRQERRARGRRSSPRPGARARSPSRPTWPAAARTSGWAARTRRERDRGRRPRRAVRHRHQPPREPAHRPPAARARRAPGRPRLDRASSSAWRTISSSATASRNLLPASATGSTGGQDGRRQPSIRTEIDHAQRVIEGQNFDIRRRSAPIHVARRDAAADRPGSARGHILRAGRGERPDRRASESLPRRAGPDSARRNAEIEPAGRLSSTSTGVWADHLAWLRISARASTSSGWAAGAGRRVPEGRDRGLPGDTEPGPSGAIKRIARESHPDARGRSTSTRRA